MSKRFSLFSVITAALALASPAIAQSPAYPSQTVRLVVPFSAGSMTDILARAVGDKLATRWSQQVIVENRPGLAGTSSVAKAAPDGLTLMLTSNGHTVIASLNQNLNFDPIKDFAPISPVATMPSILIAPADLPVKSVKELIDAAKAKPGSFNYASAGLGSATGIAGHLFRNITGADMVHVPHKGLPEANTSVLRGDTQMAFTFFNVGGDLIQSGKIKGLAVTGSKRLAALPDVPTFKEAGLPQFEYDAWFGVMAPAGTPQGIIDKVGADVAAVLADPDLKKRFEPLGVDLGGAKSDAFAAIIARDAERFAKILPKPTN
jgi:tripartite-type tricarboxylate transporter receptor subunit TctC